MPNDGRINKTLQEAEIIEDHIHNVERFLGARPGWNGLNNVNSAINTSLTPFRIDAGNNTWGVPLCIVGSGDTPVRAGRTMFDFRRLTLTQTQRNALYRIRFAWGASYAAGILADQFTEWEFIPLTAAQDSGPLPVWMPRLPAGSIIFAATWCLGQVSGTIDFTVGLHEYFV